MIFPILSALHTMFSADFDVGFAAIKHLNPI
jgi:hypothetical protein